MKRFVLCIALLTCQQTLAADDLEFATPVVTETSPACDDGACSTTQSAQSHVAHLHGRRPIARWFQQRRPVRRALRAVVTFVGHRCCR